MGLKSTYPDIFDCFIREGFVAEQILRKGSLIPIDIVLEKQCNKPAKEPSGIIGISRQKEAVCKWNLIRHDKLLTHQI